ncbi:ABC transporter permease [Alicyclobacillus acidiphilus]|uniref:ABC transporter permease n=1 Tax=Alicyclobacillus acidiphilus TaxID=182455 RepID=UPI000834B9FC|nr:ABC transporter permease [Alicyclobacillus acidiphilus]
MDILRRFASRLAGMLVVLTLSIATPTVIQFYGPGGENSKLASQGVSAWTRAKTAFATVWPEEKGILTFHLHVSTMSFVNDFFSFMGLAIGSIVIAAIVAVPVGTYAAIQQKSWFRTVLPTGFLVSQSIPTYVIGVILILLFSVVWPILPPNGWNSPLCAVLPTLTLAAGNVGYMGKFVQSAVSETMQEGYILGARARGVRKWNIILKHAMKPSILTTITFFAPQIAILLNNALTIEAMFAVPGLAKLFGETASAQGMGLPPGVGMQDQYMVSVVFFIFALVVLVMNLFVDILYRVLDPRIARLTA